LEQPTVFSAEQPNSRQHFGNSSLYDQQHAPESGTIHLTAPGHYYTLLTTSQDNPKLESPEIQVSEPKDAPKTLSFQDKVSV